MEKWVYTIGWALFVLGTELGKWWLAAMVLKLWMKN